MADFDIEGARKEGYSDADIISHLAKTRDFNVEGARKEGYTDAEILGYLQPKSEIGIRPASVMEGVKSKFHQLLTDPIGTLTENQHPDKADIDSTVPYWLINGTASGEGLAARTAKNFLNTPNKGKGVLGKVSGAATAAKTAFKDAAEARSLSLETQAAKQRFNEMKGSAHPPTAPVAKAPPVAKTGSGRALTEDEIAFQQAERVPGIQPEPYTPPEPLPGRPPAARIEPSPRPTVDATPIPPPQGYIRKAPIDLSRKLRNPAVRVEPQPQAAPDATPIPGKLSSGKVPGGIQNQTPLEAIKDLPVAAPGRVRATPEARTRADEIASLTRHAQTIPLAEQTIQQGVSSKDLLALPDEARVAYMKKLGLKSTSPDTWRTYVGHVLRLERVKK